MKILTYKRTHTGDPDERGIFGINDCMGQVRGYEFDAVIGVGGLSREPQDYGIDRKITWVGINPQKTPGINQGSPTVEFQTFLLFDADGPELSSLAPSLANRIYGGGVRILINDYSSAEQLEAEKIVHWAEQAAYGPAMPIQAHENAGALRECLSVCRSVC